MATNPGTGIKMVSGKIVCEVYLLDNSMKTLLIESSSTVSDVVRTMAEKIGFRNPADDCLCFSLHECRDGVTIERALPSTAEVFPIMEEWAMYGKAKFVFMCKLYTESIMSSDDPKVIYMQYIQAVYNIITGTYPCSEEEAVQLAALQFQAKFGKHNPTSHVPGFLTDSLVEYIPGPHLANPAKSPADWEKAIFQKHSRSVTELPMQTYMNVIAKREYYGATLFAAKQEFTRSMPKKLFVGIGRNGIFLLRIPESFTQSEMETLARYPLSEIYRWAYKPGVNFYFEIKAEGDDAANPVYTFTTAEGHHMSDLLTDYAMGLLREMGLNPDGTQRQAPQPTNTGSTTTSTGGSGGGGYAATVLTPPPQTTNTTVPTTGTQVNRSNVMEPVPTNVPVVDNSGGYYTQAPVPAPVPVPVQQPIVQQQVYVPEPEPVPVPVPTATTTTEEVLPPNWSKEYDPSNEAYYYFNCVTGESSWDPPTA